MNELVRLLKYRNASRQTPKDRIDCRRVAAEARSASRVQLSRRSRRNFPVRFLPHFGLLLVPQFREIHPSYTPLKYMSVPELSSESLLTASLQYHLQPPYFGL